MINFLKKVVMIEEDTTPKGKEWYKSKTLWVNFIGFVCILVQTKYGFIISAEYQAIVLTMLNYILRLITKSPTGFIEE